MTRKRATGSPLSRRFMIRGLCLPKSRRNIRKRSPRRRRLLRLQPRRPQRRRSHRSRTRSRKRSQSNFQRSRSCKHRSCRSRHLLPSRRSKLRHRYNRSRSRSRGRRDRSQSPGCLRSKRGNNSRPRFHMLSPYHRFKQDHLVRAEDQRRPRDLVYQRPPRMTSTMAWETFQIPGTRLWQLTCSTTTSRTREARALVWMVCPVRRLTILPVPGAARTLRSGGDSKRSAGVFPKVQRR